MATHEIRIDRSKTLTEEPGTGHNRWHPDIPPVVRCEPGDEVVLETRDALDGQLGPAAGLDAVAAANLDVVHPLTGPVYVEGAEPGDLLTVEIVDVEPDTYGFTVQIPGFGFLRDVFPEPYKVNWNIAGDWATSAELPGVRIPGSPFMGTIGLSPGHELLAVTTAREQTLIDRGGLALPPSASGAVPADPRLAMEGLRTIPPREQAGNVDIKQLGQGATTGISVTKDGVNHSEDITLAARNALLNMIDHLGERGWTRQQAYAICSVAVDLKISQVVDAPNMLVSAFLPEDIFVS
jgi:formamidase